VIRKHVEKDLEEILNIWQQASTLAHPFLNSSFVKKVEMDMRNLYIPNSETWVYEEEKILKGFISMIDNEIGGLFVLPSYQSGGIGRKLVKFICEFHKELEVEVFEDNLIGKSFYEKYGFELLKKFTHAESGAEVLRLKLSCY